MIMVETLTIQELFEKSKILTKDELILDVRTPEEYAAGHVPGSRNISHDGIGPYAQELKSYKRVYVYCRSGGRVQFACHELFNMGLRNLAAVVNGGMPDWVSSGFPVEI